MKEFKVLSYSEEKKLSIEEKKQYYYDLRKYIENLPITRGEQLHLNFCELINKKLVRSFINLIKGYDLEITGRENIPQKPVIYASTHQDFNDHFNIVLSIPDHAIILNTSTVTNLFKFFMSFNGITYVDRTSDESKFNSKLKLMKNLSSGKSIVIFPEGTYNCSPNKLFLPLHIGALDIAAKMQVPIVPTVQEYVHDQSILDGKNRVTSCHVHFGKPIFVSEEDNLKKKKQELEDAFATIRYSLIEEKGLCHREEVTNDEYINYVKSRINTWKMINVDINDERRTIYHAYDDFYLFHHVNDVAFDEQGNLLPTEYVSNLDKIYKKNLQ